MFIQENKYNVEIKDYTEINFYENTLLHDWIIGNIANDSKCFNEIIKIIKKHFGFFFASKEKALKDLKINLFLNTDYDVINSVDDAINYAVLLFLEQQDKLKKRLENGKPVYMGIICKFIAMRLWYSCLNSKRLSCDIYLPFFNYNIETKKMYIFFDCCFYGDVEYYLIELAIKYKFHFKHDSENSIIVYDINKDVAKQIKKIKIGYNYNKIVYNYGLTNFDDCNNLDVGNNCFDNDIFKNIGLENDVFIREWKGKKISFDNEDLLFLLKLLEKYAPLWYFYTMEFNKKSEWSEVYKHFSYEQQGISYEDFCKKIKRADGYRWERVIDLFFDSKQLNYSNEKIKKIINGKIWYKVDL